MLVRDSIVYFIARLFTAAFSISSIAILTRYLSADEYGLYVLILSGTSLISLLFFSWNTQAVFRYYASSELRGTLRKTGFIGYCFSLLVALFLSLVLYLCVGHALKFEHLLVAALLVFTLSFLDYNLIILNAERRAFIYAMLQAGRAAIILFIGGLAAYLTKSSLITLLSVAGGWLILLMFSFTLSSLKHIFLDNFNKQTLFTLFRYGFPLSISIGVMQLVGTIDRFMLSHFADNIEVARYSVAYDLSQFSIGAVGGALSLAFYSKLLAEYNNLQETEISERLENYSTTLMAILLPVTVGLILVAPSIVHIMVGSNLRSSALEVMPWICVAMFVGVYKAYYTDLSFQLARWTYGAIIASCSMLTLNILMNFLLIPRYGAIGAAQACLISFIFGLLVSLIVGYYRGRKLSFSLIENTKILISSIMMVPVIWNWRNDVGFLPLVMQTSAGVLVYISMLVVLNAFNIRILLIQSVRH